MSRKTEEIFHAARALTESKRATFLKSACGKDVSLRAEVEALLRADAEAGGFLASPTGPAEALSEAPLARVTEQAGSQIGRYKLLEQIGEGGMGTIWLAEQREPVKRRVALKIIKLGMDTKQVIARFEAERQALAMMDHPHIAKVFDAGTTDGGRPYFVMEYIRGIPILEYCDKEKIDTRSRLELFTKVCQAIQHAHQKGIIHRDIKPSNVLVTLHDGVPVPKVIDFGIAKATNSELTAKTLFTEHQQIVGTPAYMSPEQAEMSGLDIDTRSDIYSLGVLLYELLTGVTPFDMRTLLKKGFAEMLRAIREDEPSKPSTRISTLGETGTKTAQQRRVDAKKLGSLLRGDVDWIVMKCLEKDRNRRYETASGLAADIQRHLNDEPVTAGAPSAGYKLRKFVRRNRGQVLAGTAVIAALLIGLVAFAWQAKVAEEQRAAAELAREEAKKQQARAEEREVEARKQEQEAQRQAAIAEAVARFQTDMLAAVAPEKLPLDPITKEPLQDRVTVLQAMQAAIQALEDGSLKEQVLVEARIRATIGSTLCKLGRYAEAEPILRRALAILREEHPSGHPNVASALQSLAHCLKEQHQVAEADALLREAISMQRALEAVSPLFLASSLDDLGVLLVGANRAAEAEPLFREALAIRRAAYPKEDPRIAHGLQTFATFLLDKGEATEAEPLLREALALDRASLATGHPRTAAVLDTLAMLLRDQGRYAEAEPLAREALASRRSTYAAGHPHIAHSLTMLGTILFGTGRLTEADALLREALEILRAARPAQHPSIGDAAAQLGILSNARRQFAEAEALFREALEIFRAAYPPGHPEIARVRSHLGVVYWRQEQLEKAIPLFEEALRSLEAARGRRHPSTQDAIAYLGTCYGKAGRFAEAISLLEEAREASKQNPRLRGFAVNLLAAYAKTSDPALPEHQRRMAHLVEELNANAHATFPAGSAELAAELSKIIQPLLEAELNQLAEPLVRECAAIRRALLPAHPFETAAALHNLASLLERQEKLADAEALYREALELDRAALPAGHRILGLAAGTLASILRKQGRFAEAEPLLYEAIEIARGADPSQLDGLTSLYIDLAEVRAQLGKIDEARASIRELLTFSRANLPEASSALAGQLARCGRAFLDVSAWAEAEALLRESLQLREKIQPDVWTTFNTRSVLGAALLAQQKLAEAEPLLLDGYRGMKEREASIPPQGAIRISEALERLLQLYEAQGNTSETARWRRELEEARAKSKTAESPGGKE